MNASGYIVVVYVYPDGISLYMYLSMDFYYMNGHLFD